MQYPLDPHGEALGRAGSPGSLTPSGSTRSDPELFKRISYSEAALHKAISGQLTPQDEPPLFPGFVPASSSSSVSSAMHTNPTRLMSRSHHNLGQVPESPEHRAAAAALGLSAGGGGGGGMYGSHGGLGPPLYQLQQQQQQQQKQPYQQHQRTSSDTDSMSFSGTHQQDK